MSQIEFTTFEKNLINKTVSFLFKCNLLLLRQVLLMLLYYLLANSVNTKCRPSKLIAIPFCKIIIDALGQGAHCFVSFFIINIEQIIV